METITGKDARTAAADTFLDVILADPDLFEDAFAAVVASWHASPPGVPPNKPTATRPPGPSGRLPRDHSRDAHQDTRRPRTNLWQLRHERSPPPHTQS